MVVALSIIQPWLSFEIQFPAFSTLRFEMSFNFVKNLKYIQFVTCFCYNFSICIQMVFMVFFHFEFKLPFTLLFSISILVVEVVLCVLVVPWIDFRFFVVILHPWKLQLFVSQRYDP